jgi:hypothetical protein
LVGEYRVTTDSNVTAGTDSTVTAGALVAAGSGFRGAVAALRRAGAAAAADTTRSGSVLRVLAIELFYRSYGEYRINSFYPFDYKCISASKFRYCSRRVFAETIACDRNAIDAAERAACERNAYPAKMGAAAQPH